jgi:predicted nucleotidyltransferase
MIEFIKNLSTDFYDFIKILCKQRVKFVVVGGIAVNYHGYLRGTRDLDILCIVSDSVILDRVISEFSGQSVVTDLDYSQVLQLGIPPFRIDIMRSISGITAEDVYESAETAAELDGWPVKVISKKDLITNKKASGRYRDLDDIENLEKRS